MSRTTLLVAFLVACGGPEGGPHHGPPPEHHAETPPPEAPKPAAKPARPMDPKPIPAALGLGRPATPEEVAAWDKDVDASGRGLPAGQGDVATGRDLFKAQCIACHGLKGEGTPIAPALIGREPMGGFGDDPELPRTIGNYWPYPTTIYDYIQRAMPQTAPGSLKPEQVYALTAFLLAENGAVPEDFVADKDSLPKVVMPKTVTFVMDDREESTEVR